MIHDQNEPDSFNFESKPEYIDFNNIKISIATLKHSHSLLVIKRLLESELSLFLNNIKVNLKGVKSGYNVTITGWFYVTERDPTEEEMIDFLEEQINDIIKQKIEN